MRKKGCLNKKNTFVEKECPICGKTFLTKIYRMKLGRGIHCSRECRNKSYRVIKHCDFCKKELPQFPMSVKFCSKECRMKGSFGEARRKIVARVRLEGSPLKGIPRPDFSGDKHPLWKGGITPTNTAVRNSRKYVGWRKLVFERDLFTCVECSTTGGYLHADHIKLFSEYPMLQFEVSNGRTLCVPCHYKITFKKTMPEDSGWGHKYFSPGLRDGSK